MCYLYVTLLSLIVFEMYIMMSRSLARVYPGGREKMPCVLVLMHSVLTLNSTRANPPFPKSCFCPLLDFLM